jgi:hypothetical protein
VVADALSLIFRKNQWGVTISLWATDVTKAASRKRIPPNRPYESAQDVVVGGQVAGFSIWGKYAKQTSVSLRCGVSIEHYT